MHNSYIRLKELQSNYPALTFQNNGYEYLSKAVQEEHAEQIAEISAILKDTVLGFTRFNNFKLRSDGSIVVRLQFNWSAGTDSPYFEGVGYFPLEDWNTPEG